MMEHEEVMAIVLPLVGKTIAAIEPTEEGAGDMGLKFTFTDGTVTHIEADIDTFGLGVLWVVKT